MWSIQGHGIPASALDLEMVGCFLDNHVTKFLVKNKQVPVIEWRTSRSPIQSLSLYATNEVLLDPGFLKIKPLSNVHNILKYFLSFLEIRCSWELKKLRGLIYGIAN